MVEINMNKDDFERVPEEKSGSCEGCYGGKSRTRCDTIRGLFGVCVETKCIFKVKKKQPTNNTKYDLIKPISVKTLMAVRTCTYSLTMFTNKYGMYADINNSTHIPKNDVFVNIKTSFKWTKKIEDWFINNIDHAEEFGLKHGFIKLREPEGLVFDEHKVYVCIDDYDTPILLKHTFQGTSTRYTPIFLCDNTRIYTRVLYGTGQEALNSMVKKFTNIKEFDTIKEALAYWLDQLE